MVHVMCGEGGRGDMTGAPTCYRVVCLRVSSCKGRSLWLWCVRACFASADVYALQVVKPGCTMDISMSCIDEGTVRNIVLGTVVVETSWEEDFCQVLAN